MPRHSFRTLAASACALLLASTASPADDELIATGAELYADFCSECHGDDVDGLQDFSDDLDAFTRRLEGETEDMRDFTDVFDPDEILAMHRFLEDVTN